MGYLVHIFGTNLVQYQQYFNNQFRKNNLPADGIIPDVEFQKNGETWVLGVRFTKSHNEEESFASKTDKY